MKQKKYIISIVLIVLAILVTTVCFVINSMATNAVSTEEQRQDEKTFIRTVASTVRANSANYKISAANLASELDRYVGSGKTNVTEQSSDILLVTFIETGNAYEVNVNNGPIFENEVNGVSPSEIFDENGTNTDGLHIGDFVNYDAGTWTAAEINAIQTGKIGSLVTANGSTGKPSTEFQFGGFAAGSSRNGNATPFHTTYNYLKDKSTGNAITGWRVFDIEGNNVILISAGNPEDYYHKFDVKSGYASEYILSGNVNNSWSETEASNYQKRNWNDYVNTDQKAISATAITKSRLDSWYSKYIVADADTYDETTFQKIYDNAIEYQNVVDNYSFYWLSADYDTNYMYYVNTSGRYVSYNCNFAYGVRILVTLSPDVRFTETKTGTKTLTGGHMDTYGGYQTYNCWDIL